MTIVASKHQKMSLAERVLADGLIDEEQLREASEEAAEKGVYLGQYLASTGALSPSILGRLVSDDIGYPVVDLASTVIDSDTARLLPEAFLRRKRVLTFADNENAIRVAMADPLDLATVDDIRARLNRRIQPFFAFEADLRDATNRLLNTRLKTQTLLDEIGDSVSDDPDLSVDALVDMAEEAPIVRLVNSIISAAISGGASDIHIEPQESAVRVRYRMDGLLYEQALIPRTHLAAVVSRIKIVSQLNIAERRRPQDGRFGYRDDNGNEYDLRVSILPLMHGEKVVMRVLEKNGAFANTNMLGFFPEQKELFESLVRRPYGMLLVTGPTGSGKSTTLFAALNQINDSTRNINTVEDPVEYNLPGANQMQVNPKIGFTFAAGLRSLLRQDPDVIMVGEIRDKETAEIAIQAALTGHLVLSTLHTNDAAGALTRLQNMGVEPFLISSSLIGVIGQRLLRTVCPYCREARPMSPSTLTVLGLPTPKDMPPTVAYGKGCTKCGGRGMKGRTAVYEVMTMSEKLREMVLERCSSADMRSQAIAEGMITMRDGGMQKVMNGVTTPDEVVRVLCSEEF